MINNNPKANMKTERSTSKQLYSKTRVKERRKAKREKDTSISPWACNPRRDNQQDPAW